ncbi:MAG: hypothetical protein R6W72_00915 [Desulfurivibrionaceae bacterium]
MKAETGFIIATMFALLVFSVAESSGQRMGRGGGWGMGGSYGRMYDPATVETISGEVVEVGQVIPRKGMSPGVHLGLRGVDGKMISVHLGPAWFIENQEIVIEPGDKVEVKGSRIIFDGQPAIIAQEVGMGEDVLKLRDGNGYPVWRGWRRR